MIQLGDAVWLIRSDDSPLQQGLTNATNSVKSAMDGILTHSRSIGIGLGIVGGAITGFLGSAVNAAADAEENLAQLRASITSTGGAAGMTEDALASLANELSKMSAIEDDTIIGAEALMLTFTRVGKEVFPEAMTAALDLSRKMGGDLQGAIQMVARALNDPIQGMTALTRVGVSFTDKQKEMIAELLGVNEGLEKQREKAEKAYESLGKYRDQLAVAHLKLRDMNDSGRASSAQVLEQSQKIDQLERKIAIASGTIQSYNEAQAKVASGTNDASEMMKAQQIILAELGTEFGGSAAAYAKTFSGQMDELKNTLGNLMEEIGSALMPALKQMGEAIVPIIEKAVAWMKANPELTATLAKVAAVIGLVALALMPLFMVLPGIVTAFGLASTAIGLISVPVAIAIAAIVAIIAIGALLVANWEDIKEFLGKAWDGIKAAAMRVWDALVDYFEFQVNAIKKVFGVVSDAFWAVVNAIYDAFSWAWDKVVGFWDGVIGVFEWARDTVVAIWDYIIDAIRGGINAAIGGLNDLLAMLGLGNFQVQLLGPEVPGRAVGGPVHAGLPYIVGERGSELFIPETAGRIVNANDTAALMGGGQPISITINGANRDPREIADEVSRVLARRQLAMGRA